MPNDVSFQLNPSQIPQVYIDSISVSNTTFSSDLLYSTDRVLATIDSSTPFIWLPKPACDRFAQSLGLIYDQLLNLYTFAANSTAHNVLQNSSLTFMFSLSDISSSPDTVTITFPYDAFDLQLTYPAIPGTGFTDANSTMFYFPLRQATDETQYTVGRVFLQEAYLITDYERNNFSIHQAVHTPASILNTSIVAITRPPSSILSGPPVHSSGTRLSTGAIVGIVVGAVVVTAMMIFAVLCCRRKRDKRPADDEKPIAQSCSFLSCLRRRKQPLTHEADGDINYPTEVGADATHERFELPAPLRATELDSDSGTLNGTSERGCSTHGSANITAYERARRKLERQGSALQAQHNKNNAGVKTDADISPVGHYRPLEIPDTESPLVSPLGPQSRGSSTVSGVPSPVSPGFVSSPTSQGAPPPRYTKINPAKVVYAGRLPSDVQLPQIMPRMIDRDGRTIRSDETFSEPSTLGSHYTEFEDELLDTSGDTRGLNAWPSPQVEGRSADEGHPPSPSEPWDEDESRARRVYSREGVSNTQEMLDPWESRRRLEGEDLVHVPQPAANRFSWEEERTEGKD